MEEASRAQAGPIKFRLEIGGWCSIEQEEAAGRLTPPYRRIGRRGGIYNRHLSLSSSSLSIFPRFMLHIFLLPRAVGVWGITE